MNLCGQCQYFEKTDELGTSARDTVMYWGDCCHPDRPVTKEDRYTHSVACEEGLYSPAIETNHFVEV